ncbi:hypothetical protein CYMTET_41408 [Cymbomonas tetramitiformis]|uniref:Uncharacterized protein n=1 Tax=Cymbomonas tetramitiformis TaxID=36881 RepID=A0AAE0F3M6_9CHLO|nr:hypothetical protein CYMTET_41408 [Cymbomonas tetramitiformis]
MANVDSIMTQGGVADTTAVLVASPVDGMAQLVKIEHNGVSQDPVDNPEVYLTCGNITLKYGALTKPAYCFYNCAVDPSCHWVVYDTVTKNCEGGKQVCSTQTLANTVNKKRLGVKLRMEVVTYNGAQIYGATFLSATSHVYRPHTSTTTGISCLMADNSAGVSACSWSKVSGMELTSFQHDSTGTGNIYELQDIGIGIGASSQFQGVTFDNHVCPGMNSVRPIPVNDEGLSMKKPSCASYLSNDIQSHFAILVKKNGTWNCYLLASCGSSSNPMVSYTTAFGLSSPPGELEVVVMAKQSMISPMNLDSETGAGSLAETAAIVGATIYNDHLQRISDPTTYMSAGHPCLSNPHGLYDSGQLAISSVCVPSSSCSIWGTESGYREDMQFFEDACSMTSSPQCCANETEVTTLTPCSTSQDVDSQCATEIRGVDATMNYNEIEFTSSMSTFVVIDADLHQKKRTESDLQKDGDQKLTPTCTYKVDVYSNCSYSLEGSSVVPLRGPNELSTSYSTHVSKACPQVESDPRLNEIVITQGKQSTHISRKIVSSEELRVIARSPMAPYANDAKAPVPMMTALYNFDNMVEDTTQRGTGFFDSRRPTVLEWNKIEDGQTYASFELPNTQSNNDGSTIGQTLNSATAEKSTVFLSAQEDGLPKAGTSRVVAQRSIRTTEETVSVCFNLCERDAVFSITAFDPAVSGSSTAFFNQETKAAHVTSGGTGSETVVINRIAYPVPGGHSPLNNFSSMHLVDEENLVVVEIRELGSSQDHRRVTYRTLDRQNALRLGGACIHDLALVSNKTYEISAQYPKPSGMADYTLDSLCRPDQAQGQGVTTVDYLTGVLQDTDPVVTSLYPSFQFLQEEPKDWSLLYHDASSFKTSNPDSTYDALFDEELRAIEKVAETPEQMINLLHRLCEDITFATTDPDYGLPIPACLGFTYRMRMNPGKEITSGGTVTPATYGEFCYANKPSLFTSKADCENRYTVSGCQMSSVIQYPQFDQLGNIEKVSVPNGSERLFEPTDSLLADSMDNPGRPGGTTRSACGTYRDRMIDFYEAELFVSYPVSGDIKTEMLNKNVTMDSTMSDVQAQEIERKNVESKNYQVSPKMVADNGMDRVTYLRNSMYSVVVNTLTDQMRNTSIHVHTDQIIAQAFGCGVPALTTGVVYTGSDSGGLYADTYVFAFEWNDVIEVNGENVQDSEMSFSWGRTQEDAMTEMISPTVKAFAFPSKCTASEQDPPSFVEYMKKERVCGTVESMKWKTNPNNNSYPTNTSTGRPIALADNPQCEAQTMQLKFSGLLSDFLDLTNASAPYHINRQDYAGAYTHKTQLQMRQKLHLQSGNTIERDVFYPVTITTYSTSVMSLSAQSAVIPPAISQLKGVTVQYDYSTFSSVVELSTRTCVSQPVPTTSNFKYTLVNPITNYDTTRINPSFDAEVRALGKPVFGQLGDGITSIPGSMGEMYILNADDTDFSSTAFQGLNDPRFDNVAPIACQLLRQETKEEGLPGSNQQFQTTEAAVFANSRFEFNCFDRLYACNFDNVDQWANLHIRFGNTFIVKSGNLFTVDPLDPAEDSYFTSISVTTAAQSATQEFAVTLSADSPPTLQEYTEMPSWSVYHAPGSDGMSTLRAIVDGTGAVSTRIERGQRFRLTAHLSDINQRSQYVLYPMSLFAILKLQNKTNQNSQSNGNLQSTGGSIGQAKSDLCGIDPSMATDLNALEELGKLVPIYQGIFNDGISATDNSFYNPTTTSLDQHLNYAAVSPQLLKFMQSSQLYVSKTLQGEIFPILEKGGLHLGTSSNSWQMINNLDVTTPADMIFELTFCFLGAVATKFDSGYDTSKLLAEARYVDYTATTCATLAGTLQLTFGGSVTEDDQPFGCYGVKDSTTGSVTEFAFNPSTQITSFEAPGDRMYVCPDPYLVNGEAYKERLSSLTCGQTIYSAQLTAEECSSNYAAGNYQSITSNTRPPGCIFVPASNQVAASYMYNNAASSTVECGSTVQCKCERASLTTTLNIVNVQDGICSVSSDVSGNARRKLLGYTTGQLSIGSRSTDTDTQLSGSVEHSHRVELATLSRSSSTDGSASSTTETSGTTNTDADGEHDDHDSKKLRTILIVAITFFCVVFVLLVFRLVSVVFKLREARTGKSPHWILKNPIKRAKTNRQTTKHSRGKSYLSI